MWIYIPDNLKATVEPLLKPYGIEFPVEDKELDDKYRDAARTRLTDEDDVEDDAVVSLSSDPGAYVMAWIWVRDADAGIFNMCEYCGKDLSREKTIAGITVCETCEKANENSHSSKD